MGRFSAAVYVLDCPFLTSETKVIELPTGFGINLEKLDACEYVSFRHDGMEQLWKILPSPRAKIDKMQRWWFVLKPRVVIRAKCVLCHNISERHPDERIRKLAAVNDNYLDFFLENPEVFSLIKSQGGVYFLDNSLWNYEKCSNELLHSFSLANVHYHTK